MRKKRMIICTTVPISFCFFKGQINKLQHSFEVKILSSKGDEFDKFCSKEDVEGIRIPMKREISLIRDFINLIQFIYVFTKERPDIIHANTPKASLLSLCAAWITRVPHRLYYVHGLRYEGSFGFKKKVLQFCERMSCYFATDIFTVGKGVKNTMTRDNITKKHTKIIHNGTINGIDSKYYCCAEVTKDLRSCYDLTDEAFVLGFVGRIVKDKGINELVAAFKKISKSHTNAYLFLVGYYEDHLDALTYETLEEINGNPQIVCTGPVKDVRTYLKLFDVFLLPSYREGFNNAILEALSMGVPCICTDINGCNEAIEQNRNGILIEPRCEKALRQAIEKVISDRSFLHELKKNSRPSILEKYSQKLVWEQSLQAYEKIVEESCH